MLSKKRIRKLKDRIELCDSFIEKGIDVDFYRAEKERLKKLIDKEDRKQIILVRVLSGVALFVVFFGLFILIYFILSQIL